MNVENVKAWIENIVKLDGDDERQHSMEDDLYLNLLCSIAEGDCEDPQACAKEAIKSQELFFVRWCA